MHKLADQRSHCTAGLNNRTFSTKRTACSDRDRRRDRLQNRDFGLDPAAVDQDGFHGFRNAVPANLVGAVPRHNTDDDAPNHRCNDYPQAKVVIARTSENERHPMKEEDVREQADEVVQQVSDSSRQHTNQSRQERHQHSTKRCWRVIIAPFRMRGVDAVDADGLGILLHVLRLTLRHDPGFPVDFVASDSVRTGPYSDFS